MGLRVGARWRGKQSEAGILYLRVSAHGGGQREPMTAASEGGNRRGAAVKQAPYACRCWLLVMAAERDGREARSVVSA